VSRLNRPAGVFLIATESVEHFGKDDVELLPQCCGHEGLEALGRINVAPDIA
jgi:hypothetical protein